MMVLTLVQMVCLAFKEEASLEPRYSDQRYWSHSQVVNFYPVSNFQVLRLPPKAHTESIDATPG